MQSKQTFMGILYAILVGVLAGFLAGLVMKGKGFGFLLNLVIGIVGALIGNWLFDLFHVHLLHGFKGELLRAFVGAVILLALVNALNKSD